MIHKDSEDHKQNEQLRQLYKKLVRTSYFNSLHVGSNKIRDWYKAKYGRLNIQHRSGGSLRWDRVATIAAEYNKEVALRGITNVQGVYIKHIGRLRIYEVNSVNGKPRRKKMEDGSFEWVIEDVFTKTVKYALYYSFNIRGIRKELLPFLNGATAPRQWMLYLPMAYKVHPNGKFYTKKS